jgi:hypothetical protein
VGGLAWRRLLQRAWALRRLPGSSASSMRPVALRMDRGMMWSTVSAPGCPHSQHTLQASSTCCLMRRHGLPRRPVLAAGMGAHQA